VAVQLLLIRHALPLRSEAGQGSDPELSEAGIEQARRLPGALARFPIARVVASPQRRALQTARPVAESLGLAVEIDERFAEYDREMSTYIPIEDIRSENPAEWARMADGHLPSGVDEAAFLARVAAGIDAVVTASEHEETVAVVGHGGVINVVLHQILGTARLLSVPVDYASVTRLLFARSGQASVVAVNCSEHVWDLLPRNRRS
jgi:probable phosphoglycerate mutase